jgi:hypothetical protein
MQCAGVKAANIRVSDDEAVGVKLVQKAIEELTCRPPFRNIL